MQRLGFIHDMMDVKILILFVMGRVKYPVDREQLYELCFQDDSLSYFDVCTAVPQMLESGHLEYQAEDGQELYVITEKGRSDGPLTEDSLAFTVKQRAEDAVTRFNRQIRRKSLVSTEVVSREEGKASVIVTLKDDFGMLMKLELPAPNQRQAVRLSKLFEEKAEMVYNLMMLELADGEEGGF